MLTKKNIYIPLLFLEFILIVNIFANWRSWPDVLLSFGFFIFLLPTPKNVSFLSSDISLKPQEKKFNTLSIVGATLMIASFALMTV